MSFGGVFNTLTFKNHPYVWFSYCFLNSLGLFSEGLFFLLCFLPRELSLALVVRLVWWCWILLTLPFLESFWFLQQIWRRVLLGRVFLVVGSSLQSVQSLSHVQLFATLWTAACQASLSITNSQRLLKLMSIESVMPSNHLILCHLLLLLPSNFPNIRVFSNESVVHIRWPKYWSFSFSISLSNEYSALISFRMDWLDLLAVQGTLKSLLQHHSSKASILRRSAFFIVQLSIHIWLLEKP